jgi:outer membrane protein assembly factor BamB
VVAIHGRVYVATSFESLLDDCGVAALDLTTGDLVWRQPVDSSIKHSPAVYGDHVLAVSQAGTLYCFDRAGDRRWDASLSKRADHRWDKSFPVTDGRTVFAGRAVGFGAFDLGTGEARWHKAGGRDWLPHIHSGPSLGTDMVYQGGWCLRALDPGTGKVRWAQRDMSVSTAAVEKTDSLERLYVFQIAMKADGALSCLDGTTGETVWQAWYEPAEWGARQLGRAVVPMGHETGTPAVGERVVCLGSGYTRSLDNKRSIAAMRGFDKQTGELMWQFEVGPGVVSSVPYERNERTITSSPVIVGDVVYFGANDGNLYALDVNTGKRLWHYHFGVPIASTVAVTGNTLVVSGWDGTVYALTSQSKRD